MMYRHPLLGYAIGWKFNHQPGMSTVDGGLTQWPASLGAWPSDVQQAQWVSEYEAYLASAQCQDDALQAFLDSHGGKAVKALALVGMEKGLWTLAELKAKYRSLA